MRTPFRPASQDHDTDATVSGDAAAAAGRWQPPRQLQRCEAAMAAQRNDNDSGHDSHCGYLSAACRG